MNIENPINHWNQTAFWNKVELSFPGIRVVNKDSPISPVNLKALIVLCPLYQQGSLTEAGLISPPDGIWESRVAKKVDGYTSVLRAMSSGVRCIEGKLNLEVVFANRGVLLGRNPTKHDEELLDYHQDKYEEYFRNLCKKEEMSYSFGSYNSLGIDFPQFINPESALPSNLSDVPGTPAYQMLAKLNDFLNLPDIVVNNNNSRKKAKDIIDAVKFIPAFWLIAGYLVFDYKIQQLLSGNGIYLSAERMVSLWGISSLTPGLNEVPRIQIPA